jgi:DNA-binding CsgD family transcriptional regulator
MNKLGQDRLIKITHELAELLGRGDSQPENQTETVSPPAKRLLGDLAALIYARIAIQESADSRSGLTSLTRREREILTLIASGKTSKEIARILNLGVKTSETHRRNLFVKLGYDGVADLTRFAIREGLIKP